MKIITVIGARPQFIKAAVVSREIRKNHTEILIHTGQHYDYNMSDIFFEELEIPKPDYNLGISGGTHGQMTGAMLVSIEEVLLKENPNLVLIYGDTNSTLAAALAAVKLHIPICHVESGIRFGTLTNPEEVNRICTDHVSELLLCCTESAIKNLDNEGLRKKALLVGDPMYDAFLYYQDKLTDKDFSDIIDKDDNIVDLPENYYYMTCHREENTQSEEQLKEILSAMNELDYKTIYPVHPRNKASVAKLCTEYKYSNLIITNPVGYLTSIALVKNAIRIVTDSGGLQREAFFAKVPCVTVLNHVLWPETMVGNMNILAKPNKIDILDKLSREVEEIEDYKPFGDGKSANKIIEAIDNMFLI